MSAADSAQFADSERHAALLEDALFQVKRVIVGQDRMVERAGRRALAVPADLLDRAQLEAAVATVLGEWGHIDLLLNNGRYIGPGHMDPLVDTPLDVLEQHLEANVMAPLALIKLVLPQMIERGGGLILNMTSGVAWTDPPSAAGRGGWGLGYAISKGAMHRIAGVLAHEIAGTGVSVVNVSPGFVATERIAIDMAEFGFDAAQGAPPDLIGQVVAWLATSGAAPEWNGRTLEAQDQASELGFV